MEQKFLSKLRYADDDSTFGKEADGSKNEDYLPLLLCTTDISRKSVPWTR